MTSSLFKIPEEFPLKDKSPLLGKLEFSGKDESFQPRALRALSIIVARDLCHRCGSCVGICPTDALGLDSEGYPKVDALSACTDCDLCVRVCPGDEFDFYGHHQKKFEEKGNISDTHGHFIDSFIGYGLEKGLRKDSTSGGVISALLLSLLRRGEIDGAVVIVSDEEVLWKGKPIIARTEKEILSAVKSKYAITPTNIMLKEILRTPGRYALVGLPCQIHGYVKASELDPRLKERVVVTIGLYCHAAVEHEAYRVIWKGLGEKVDDAVKFISRIGKHPGTPHIELQDGTLVPIYFPEKTGCYRPSSMEIINILYRLYSPPRCLTCFDASSEFSDISVGDPWMAPPDDDVNFYDGWSFALVRTEKGRAVCDNAVSNADLFRKAVTRREALLCNKMMSTEKRWRAFRIIETHKRQGRAIPLYGPIDMEMPKQSGWQFLKTEINMITHTFCYLPRYRARVLRFMLSNRGYFLLRLNNFRRVLRTHLRDWYSKMRRKLFGRS